MKNDSRGTLFYGNIRIFVNNILLLEREVRFCSVHIRSRNASVFELFNFIKSTPAVLYLTVNCIRHTKKDSTRILMLSPCFVMNVFCRESF